MKVSILGNIGCGKTTLIHELNRTTRIPIFLEPIEEWEEGLDLFYKNPDRWGFTFNLNVLLSFYKWKNNQFKAIYERSPRCCKHVFMKSQKDMGHLHDYEQKMFDQIYNELSWEPDIIIYIRSDPKVCYDRTMQRSRSCESNVELSYLEMIHNNYEAMIQDARTKGIPVYVVDGNKKKEEVYNIAMAIIQSI